MSIDLSHLWIRSPSLSFYNPALEAIIGDAKAAKGSLRASRGEEERDHPGWALRLLRDVAELWGGLWQGPVERKNTGLTHRRRSNSAFKEVLAEHCRVRPGVHFHAASTCTWKTPTSDTLATTDRSTMCTHPQAMLCCCHLMGAVISMVGSDHSIPFRFHVWTMLLLMQPQCSLRAASYRLQLAFSA